MEQGPDLWWLGVGAKSLSGKAVQTHRHTRLAPPLAMLEIHNVDRYLCLEHCQAAIIDCLIPINAKPF